jgi:hypothetical protein
MVGGQDGLVLAIVESIMTPWVEKGQDGQGDLFVLAWDVRGGP